MLTVPRKFKYSNSIGARAPLFKERNHMRVARMKDEVKRFMLFVAILCLCSKLMPSNDIINTTMDSFFIVSELAFLPEKLCYIWTATWDVKHRKLNYPAKHRYGLNFKANRHLFHVFLLILATNPGPCSSFTQSGLKIIYLNARSLKA